MTLSEHNKMLHSGSIFLFKPETGLAQPVIRQNTV